MNSRAELIGGEIVTIEGKQYAVLNPIISPYT